MKYLFPCSVRPHAHGGRTYWLLSDQVGLLHVVSGGLGSPVKELVYDSFGNILEDTNPPLTRA